MNEELQYDYTLRAYNSRILAEQALIHLREHGIEGEVIEPSQEILDENRGIEVHQLEICYGINISVEDRLKASTVLKSFKVHSTSEKVHLIKKIHYYQYTMGFTLLFGAIEVLLLFIEAIKVPPFSVTFLGSAVGFFIGSRTQSYICSDIRCEHKNPIHAENCCSCGATILGVVASRAETL